MKSEKHTKRRYDDACAAMHAMDILGERWALAVVRELMTGPKRFTDLRAALPAITPAVLSQRLAGLEAAGVLRRRTLPPPSAARVLELTDWGREAEPIFVALGRWGARSPAHDPQAPFGAASLMLSLRTMFDPARAAGLEARVGLRAGTEDLLAEVSGGRLTVAPGPLDAAEAVLEGGPEAVGAAIYGDAPWAGLEATGALRVLGDRALARRFAGLFPLPPKAPPGPQTPR